MTEEYEIELIDYLRVMWRWKWLIIAVLVVSVVVSAVISFTQPDRYVGTVTYRVEEFGTELGIPTPNPQSIASLLESIEPGHGLSMKVEVKADDLSSQAEYNVTLTLTGHMEPKSLKELLSDLTPLVQNKIGADIKRRINQALVLADQKKAQLSKAKEILNSQIEASTSTDLTAALADRIGDLALQLAQLDAQIETLRDTSLNDFFSLETLEGPTVSFAGPHRKLNIAVAAVLGGLVGVLLAFFLNYVFSYRQREE